MGRPCNTCRKKRMLVPLLYITCPSVLVGARLTVETRLTQGAHVQFPDFPRYAVSKLTALSTKTLSRISYKLRISPNGNEKCRFEHIDNMKATPKAQSQKEIHHPPAFGQVEGDLWTTAQGDTAMGSWEY